MLNDRINKIKDYFVSFNVVSEENASYILVKFPNKWTIPDKNSLKDAFKTEYAVSADGSVFFATELENGTDCLFDCVDYVIDFNKNVEERKALFSEKVAELSRIFAEEDLEQLKTLEFVFAKQKKEVKKKKIEKPQKTKPAETPLDTDQKESEPKEDIAEEGNDGGILAFAKSITEENN